jgi:hypothetical protein
MLAVIINHPLVESRLADYTKGGAMRQGMEELLRIY